MSNYATELAEWREMSRRYNNARIAYRAGTITDSQFLEVRDAYTEAGHQLDEAEVAEQLRQEESHAEDLDYEARQEAVERAAERGEKPGRYF